MRRRPGPLGTMTGEELIARGALLWSGLVALPATGIAYLTAGPRAATSIALAFAIILGNVGLSAVFAGVGNRLGGKTAIAMSLPSFAVRMLLSIVALQSVKGRSFIDQTVFVAAFCVALTVVLVLQSRAWKRTPWLAHAFGPSNKEIA